ncbi:MAG: hypothetical protein H9901_00095 [Candidatus Paralactobacillus gallistercoris]|uniref:Uncharacterized protein n=1 Tax=Candidatus Paralactobacillus gallistercoris TaxID=2838724 RepID=A0A948X030_9LACO|nr:hypothetical protein [Candidatus Paralactobacillus gallistercoris]
MVEEPITGLPEEIIQFEKKNGLTDTDMALASHISVEKIHNIKSMAEEADPETELALRNFMEK